MTVWTGAESCDLTSTYGMTISTYNGHRYTHAKPHTPKLRRWDWKGVPVLPRSRLSVSHGDAVSWEWETVLTC